MCLWNFGRLLLPSNYLTNSRASFCFPSSQPISCRLRPHSCILVRYLFCQFCFVQMELSIFPPAVLNVELAGLLQIGAAYIVALLLAQQLWSWYRLSHVPGPFWHAISIYPMNRITMSGKMSFLLKDLGDRYGMNWKDIRRSKPPVLIYRLIQDRLCALAPRRSSLAMLKPIDFYPAFDQISPKALGTNHPGSCPTKIVSFPCGTMDCVRN